MTRTVFAMTAAALLTVAVSGTSQAAPIAPLSAAVTADQSNVTPVYWHRWYEHRWYGHRWHGHRWYSHRRHCWRGAWGRVHCRWW